MVKHIEPPHPVGQEDLDLGILLALGYSAFATELRAALADAGYAELHRSFGYVARNLAEGPLTLTELANRLGITSPGALKIVQSIEEAGYVERISDPSDARAKGIRLTKRGRSALAAARAFHRKAEEDLVARFGARKVAVLREILGDLVARQEAAGTPLFLRPM